MSDASLPYSATNRPSLREMWGWFAKGEVALAIGIVSIIVLLILPIPPFLLDLLLAVSMTSAVLIPGRVGLVAVDALALGLPIITTDYPFHAPEADYLTPGIDSVKTPMSVAEYAAGIIAVLRDPPRLESLASAAKLRGADFSVEESAARFAAGIMRGLE